MNTCKKHTEMEHFTPARLGAIGAMLDTLPVRGITYHTYHECGCGLVVWFTPSEKVWFSTMEGAVTHISGMLRMAQLLKA